MSKRRFFGTPLDQISLQPTNRAPAYKVVIWNPNRASIHDVVLGNPQSPEYDITEWVKNIRFQENIVFENNDDAIASQLQIQLLYDPDAEPIQITEKTLLDGTPIRVFQGDVRVPQSQWLPIFTGTCRGVPTTTEHSRDEANPRQMTVACVDRAAKYLNKKVTAREYTKDTDVGRAAIETAIDWMYLDRREILIGDQDYVVGHPQSQLVDIEVLKGIAQILFTVGRKPRFDSEGFFVAADTDLNRAPIRRYETKDFAVRITRSQVLTQGNNSVRLLGLDNQLTKVTERKKRLAHGSITAGFFESKVRDTIYFSENDGKGNGGRRAQNTVLENEKVSTIGELFGEDLSWRPQVEPDGFTTFQGLLVFDTGFDAEVRIILMATWLVSAIIANEIQNEMDLLAAGSTIFTVAAVEAAIAALQVPLRIAQIARDAAMIAIILSLTELGRVYWEIHGEPFNNVYQQLATTAQLDGILTEDLREIELRNDWLYELDYMVEKSRELLKRELIKSWTYEIDMLDDPFVETDDIIQIDGLRFYVTSISKRLARPGDGRMKLTAWRLK